MSPMNSWKSMGPVVVSALKLGAVEPRRRLYAGGSLSQHRVYRSFTLYRGHCVTYGAGRCSGEAILTVFFFLFLLFEFLRNFSVCWRGSGAKKENGVHKKFYARMCLIST